MTRQITIEEVARHCGVSRATVSRVLNKEPRVRPSTIAKVEKAIQELGYNPNSHARALSGGGTKTITVLLPGTWRDYYNPLLKGMDEVSARRGYYLLIRSYNYLSEAHRIIQEKRADGFIIRNMDQPEEHRKLFRKLEQEGIPFILIGNPFPQYPSIHIDNVGGARAMAHHFFHHGFKQIVFLAGPETNIDSNDRYYGFRLGLAECGFDPDRVRLFRGDYSIESGSSIMSEIVSSCKPEAIFAANDRMALGILQYCRTKGIRIPNDLALTGFDDTFFSQYIHPSLTTVRQPILEMGSLAMEKLIQLIEGHPLASPHVILPAPLIIRESCGCGGTDVRI
ncbi:MAG: LacI family transcriptional regulator [Spirochaetes bacterium]|nr:LacI family transcriptional regulator [Spirochaetota bacterium]